MAVAYQYTVIGQDKVYQVGEFSDQSIADPNLLVTKLLKSTTINTKMPMWDLMMKNVYNIRAYQINPKDFIMNILYLGNDNGVSTGYFSDAEGKAKGMSLLHLMNLDNLNSQNNPIEGGDGLFDFINGATTNGGTINAATGRIYFPVLEPFGSHIRKIFEDEPALADKYAFDSLYRLTKTSAEQYTEKNKFRLEGHYTSSSGSEINLNALNVQPGSVNVTAGGGALTENVDYTVDYTLGRVTILNEALLNSGTNINISLENNTAISTMKKTFMGARVEHEINPDFFTYYKQKVDSALPFNDAICLYEEDSSVIDNEDLLSKLPYRFVDPHKMNSKIDVKKLQFGSKIDKDSKEREEYFTVKSVIAPNMVVLSNGLTVRLIGIKERVGVNGGAAKFIIEKTKGRRVFLRYDSIKYDSDNVLLGYLYLDNKTFINAHLLKHGLADVDTSMEYKHKSRFITYSYGKH